jgi:beta-galactosidase
MTLSRRDFIEASALSATGFLLKEAAAPFQAGAQIQIAAQTPSSATGVGRGSGTPAPVARQEFNFDQNWHFYRPPGDSADTSPSPQADTRLPSLANAVWEEVTLPHTVRLEPRDAGGGQNYQGICWYKKALHAKPEWKKQVLYVTFHGAMQLADLWLNGVHLTTHYGGYIPFTVDISNAVRFDRDNILTVRLDNSDNPEVPPGKPQNALDFTYFGGLYRSVQLQVLHPLHITNAILAGKVAGGGIFVTYPEVATAASTVKVQTDVANETDAPRSCVVKHTLTGQDGQVVATVNLKAEIPAHSAKAVMQSFQVQNPKLWHPAGPNLYLLHTVVSENGTITDDEYTRIGIRSIHFDKDHGLSINGQPFFSIGANRHQDHPYVGYALSASAHYRDAYKLRDAGFTSYRSHYPQDPSFMDACDELGILAIVSNPGWQFMGDDVFKQRAYQDAREMIRRDRNRPSVILWEVPMNETDNRPIAAKLYEIVHEEFPGPDVYASGDPITRGPVEGFSGWDLEYGSGGAGRAQQQPPTKPTWIREWGDQVDNWSDQQGRVRVARSWGETPMLVQAGSHLRALDNIYAASNRLSGGDLWAGIDAFRGYHHQPFLGAPLDMFRLPKFDYYMFQSQRPAEIKPMPVGSGPMVFLANFASFHSPSVVTVFSNCEQVRLLQNGKEVATQAPDTGYKVPHPPFSFKVGDFSSTRSMLFSNGVAPSGTEIGELRAEGLIGGQVVATHLLHSPGEPKSIQLVVDTCGRDPIADGSDWVRVYAHVCDARGTTYPYADDLVTFSVTGNGSIIGDAKIFANPVRAEAGIATNLVRMTKTPGPVTVRASAPGLKEALSRFESKPNSGATYL